MRRPSDAKAVRRIRSVPSLPRRRRDAHKGDFGRVLVIGGSRGMIGAPALAANAALRSGAGLVTVACPHSIQLAVATLCPCATTIPLPEGPAGMLDPKSARACLAGLGMFGDSTGPTVVAAGPGLGRGNTRFDRGVIALLKAFGEAGVPVVRDADALNAMPRITGRRSAVAGRDRCRRTVITPHPGEMARLWGVSSDEIQSDREGYALRTAERLSTGATDPTIVVLKGHRSIVTDGSSVFVNDTGNPGMATGGTGDVLTGAIAGLAAQGMSLLDAAVLGVHAHGRAGDLAAAKTGRHGLIATDVLESLPKALGK